MQTTLYVSPDGDDANAGTQDAPFRTIGRARDEVRTLNRDMREDIVVVLRGGVYELDAPLTFDHRDSGAGKHRVIYRAAEGEQPVLSGGRRIGGWRPDEGGRWRADTVLADFRQLYVNGRRATRARGELPDAELIGESAYRTSLGELAEWRHPSEIELCYNAVWCHTRCKVESVQRDGDGALITMLAPYFRLARKREGAQVVLPHYIENALELLTDPGEWYLDRSEGAVYYIPLPGEDMASAEVIAPAVEALMFLEGTPERPVVNVDFEGLTFAHSSWLQPSQCGLVDVQANFLLAPQEELAPLGLELLERNGKLVHVHHEYPKCPGAVVARSARGVRFRGCTFTRLGGSGLDLERGSSDNLIEGCEFADIAGTAVQVGDVLREDHHPEDDRLVLRNNRILNNHIHHAALDYKGGVGVFVGYTEGTRIAHNEIAHLPYSGISMGWGWGEEDAGGGSENYYMPFFYDTPTPARDNAIEFNHIHHIMQQLNDGGAVYMLGRQPGTVVRGNYIHDAWGKPGGIYLDEGSAEIEVCGNLLIAFGQPLNFNNHAQGRILTCPAHDNLCNMTPEDGKKACAIADKAGPRTAVRSK